MPNKTIADVLRLDAEATPGPWKGDEHAFQIYGSHGAIDTVKMPDGFTGVRIFDIRGWGSLSKLGDKEAERIQRANGDLVTNFRTAAPKMARALERILSIVGDGIGAVECWELKEIIEEEIGS